MSTNEEELRRRRIDEQPQLNCLIDKEYLIQLVTDEPDSTFMYQLIRLNILSQEKVIVQSSRRS